MAKSDFERRADQIRSQIFDLRKSLDELIHSYNQPMATGTSAFGEAGKQVQGAARQAQQNVSSVSEGLAQMGIPWWLPVAVIGAVGIGVAVYNSMRPSAEATHQRPAAVQNVAGQTPTFNPGE
ncbi:MAG TPA: hypothetical protein VNG11_05015 [Chloroflexota bacterium]|nr:hypothetical protein [Chloroflexota bacterium]